MVGRGTYCGMSGHCVSVGFDDVVASLCVCLHGVLYHSHELTTGMPQNSSHQGFFQHK